MVGFLLVPVPYALMTGPLAGLLLLSGPRTARARIWLGAALLATASSLGFGPSSPAQDLIRAGALVFIGALLGLIALTRLGTLARGVVAAGITGVLLVLGGAAVGLEWSAVHISLRTQLLDAVNAVHALAPIPQPQLQDLQTGAEWMARVYPGIAALGALAGGALAPAVTARIIETPVVPGPGRFGDFRFNDHLVWGAVGTLGVALLPLSEAGVTTVANLLVVWTGLYAGRGAAVCLTVAGRWPRGFRLALFLSTVLLLPYAVGAAVVMGLADTWLDIRRRLAPPRTGGPTP